MYQHFISTSYICHLISPRDIFNVSRLALMLKIIHQCEFKPIVRLLKKTITSAGLCDTSDKIYLDFHNILCTFVFYFLQIMQFL